MNGLSPFRTQCLCIGFVLLIIGVAQFFGALIGVFRSPSFMTLCFLLVGASLMYWSARGLLKGGSRAQTEPNPNRGQTQIERRALSRMENRPRREYRSAQYKSVESKAANGPEPTGALPRIIKASRPFIKAATPRNLYIKAARASRPIAKGAMPQPLQAAALPFDEALRRLHRLLEEGLITEEEYAAKKKQILGLS